MFKAQNKSFVKCHCKAPALIFYCGAIQRYFFSDEVPGGGSSLYIFIYLLMYFLKKASRVDCGDFLFL